METRMCDLCGIGLIRPGIKNLSYEYNLSFENQAAKSRKSVKLDFCNLGCLVKWFARLSQEKEGRN